MEIGTVFEWKKLLLFRWELMGIFLRVALVGWYMPAYCENCEEQVIPEIDDEFPFDSYCPECAMTIESGD